MTTQPRGDSTWPAAGPALLAALWTDPRRTGVFLDLDGVLAPIVARPELAAVPASTVTLVRRLVSAYGMVAIVSGRSAVEVQRLIAVPDLLVVGNHGAELSVPGRPVDSTSAASAHRDEWESLRATIECAALELETDPDLLAAGVRVERKGLSVALHTRGSGEQAAIAATIAAAAAATRHGLAVLPGRAVVDLRIPGVTKGSAVAELVRANDLTAALYIGDDGTDLDAFATLDDLRCEGGIATVKVGVASDDGPRELAGAVDLMVEFADVPAMLTILADAAERTIDESRLERGTE
jgi:trehalose 6-phosphate phosphatase